MLLSAATLWLILALVLAGLEMLSGTFYLLALAMGLLCGALAAWIGFSFALQISVAAIVSIIAAVLLRRWKAQHLPPASDTSLDIGQRVHVLDWQATRQVRVQYRGSQWDAELAEGAEGGHSEYFIVAIRGATLILHQTQPEQT